MKVLSILFSLGVFAAILKTEHIDIATVCPDTQSCATLYNQPNGMNRLELARYYGFSCWKEFEDKLTVYGIPRKDKDQSRVSPHEIIAIVNAVGCGEFIIESEVPTRLGIRQSKFNNPFDSVSKAFHSVIINKRSSEFINLGLVAPLEVACYDWTLKTYNIPRQ